MKYTKEAIENIATLSHLDHDAKDKALHETHKNADANPISKFSDTQAKALIETLKNANLNAISKVNGNNPLSIELVSQEIIFERLSTSEDKVYIGHDNTHKADIYLIKIIKAAKKDKVSRLIIQGSISNTCYYILEKFVRNNTEIREIRILNTLEGNGDLLNIYQLRFIQMVILAPRLVALDIGNISFPRLDRHESRLNPFERHLEEKVSDQITKRGSLYPLFVTYTNAQTNERIFNIIANQKFSNPAYTENGGIHIKIFLGIYSYNLKNFEDHQNLLKAISDDNILLASYILSHQTNLRSIRVKALLEPLQDIVKAGQLEMISLVFGCFDQLNQLTIDDSQDLFKAAIEHNKIEAAKLLLEIGLRPNEISLNEAITQKCYAIAIALINGGAVSSEKTFKCIDTSREKASELMRLGLYIKEFFTKIATCDDMSTVVEEYKVICKKEEYSSVNVIYNWREVGEGHSAIYVAAKKERYGCMVQLLNLYFRYFRDEEKAINKAFDSKEYRSSFAHKMDCKSNIVSILTSNSKHYICRPIINALLTSENFAPILKAALRLDDFYTHLDRAIHDPTVKRFHRNFTPEIESNQEISDKSSYEDALKSSIMYELTKAVYEMLVKHSKLDEGIEEKLSESISVHRTSKRLHPTLKQSLENYSHNPAELRAELVSRTAYILVSEETFIGIPQFLEEFYRNTFLQMCNSIFEERKLTDANDRQLSELVLNSSNEHAKRKRIRFITHAWEKPIPTLISVAGVAGLLFFAKRNYSSEENTAYKELIPPLVSLSAGLYSLYKQYHTPKSYF
jgi:hypothetical protein